MISTRIFLEMSKTNPKTKGRMVILFLYTLRLKVTVILVIGKECSFAILRGAHGICRENLWKVIGVKFSTTGKGILRENSQ